MPPFRRLLMVAMACVLGLSCLSRVISQDVLYDGQDVMKFVDDLTDRLSGLPLGGDKVERTLAHLASIHVDVTEKGVQHLVGVLAGNDPTNTKLVASTFLLGTACSALAINYLNSWLRSNDDVFAAVALRVLAYYVESRRFSGAEREFMVDTAQWLLSRDSSELGRREHELDRFICSLGFAGIREAGPVYLRAAEKGHPCSALVPALGALNYRPAVPYLLKRLTTSREKGQRQDVLFCIGTLGEMSVREVVPVICELLREKRGQDEDTLLHALRRIDDPGALPAIRELIATRKGFPCIDARFTILSIETRDDAAYAEGVKAILNDCMRQCDQVGVLQELRKVRSVLPLLRELEKETAWAEVQTAANRLIEAIESRRPPPSGNASK